MQGNFSPASSLVKPEHRAPIDWLLKQDARIRETLPTWANIGSGSDHLPGLAQMLGILQEAFANIGADRPQSTVTPTPAGGIFNLRCRPEASFRVLLSGHYDTVFGPDHPFRQCRWLKPDVLSGPGVVDMKGGLLIMLLTLEALEHYSGKSSLGWEVLITPDEETGSHHSVEALKSAAERNHLGMVFEPAQANGGIVRNRLGNGRFEARVSGRAAHTGRHFQDGRNAIVALARFIDRLDALNGQWPGVIINTGSISGGGALNVVPDVASARFHIRVPDLESYEALSGEIETLAKAANEEEGIVLQWDGRLGRPPRKVSAEVEGYFSRWQASAQACGLALDWADTGGASEGNNLTAAGLPVLDGLGVRGGGLHSDREFVEISSVIERACIHTLFLMKLADEADAFKAAPRGRALTGPETT